jgi:hypothetical protein
MNERLKELIEQATSIQGPTPYNPLTFEVFDKEKFAELMVKAFDNILLLQQVDCIGNNDKKSIKLIEKIRDRTKIFFGVEK